MTTAIVVGILSLLGALIGSFVGYRASRIAIIETIKQSEKDRSQRFITTAFSERLSAHQESYALWYRMIPMIHGHTDSLHRAVEERQEWWIDHCLYLDRIARDAFKDSIDAAIQHRELLDIFREKKKSGRNADDDLKNVTENWNTIMIFGNIIYESVDFLSFEKDNLFPNIDPVTGPKD